MQLFILGPAFGLPSIDAECNAAVALLQLRVKDRYSIVPTHSARQRLPHLVDGQARVSGYNNIVRHLANKAIFSEETQLSSKQRNDSLALSSFIEANAQTLLDISLYVGFENYRLATRPAFTKILPWHANYITPPQRRAAARKRTEHLGISSIDVDNVHEDMSNRPPGMEAVGKESGFEAETQKRASLLLPRKDTLRSLLQRPEHAAVFKLHALADNFFGPLHDLLGDHSFLLASDEPNSADCLLYGHLSLMLYPKLPQDWLTSTMRRKYRNLAAFTERMHALLGLETSTETVLSLTNSSDTAGIREQRTTLGISLPWYPPATSSLTVALREIAVGTLQQLPLVGTSGQLQLRDAKQFSFLERNLQALLLTSAVSLGVMGYLTVRTGFFIWPHGEEIHIFGQRRLSDYGHLGAALAGIGVMLPQGSQSG